MLDNHIDKNDIVWSVLERFLKYWKPLLLSYVLVVSCICLYIDNLWFLIAAIFMFLTALLYAQNVCLSMAANKDMLTGLGNKNSLTLLLEREVGRVIRNGGFLVFLFVDIDNFKSINDTHGHKAGDSVLVEVAKRLLSEKRNYDELIRYGGDEFCIICSQVKNEIDAIGIKDKLSDVLHFCHRVESGDVLVQASFGMATYPTDTEDLQQLIAIADCRMYEQKKQRKLSRMASL
jgi:diguanylate cyclase (GGDEF)-like protein